MRNSNINNVVITINKNKIKNNGGLAHYVNPRGKKMPSRLWVASRARAIRDHSQTESGRPFLFTFPFETLKSCSVLGCFSGAGRDRTISSPFASNKPSSDWLKCSTICVRRECIEQALRRREGRLFGCTKFSPPSQNNGNLRPISERKGLEPDTDEETDAIANWLSEQVSHTLRWWSWSTSPCGLRSWPSHWVCPKQLWHRMAWLTNATQYFSCKASWRWNLSRFAEPS